MKFLQEMIAKKRQAQTEAADDHAEDRDEGEYALPEMSAVSQEASELRAAAGGASASIIPYRQRDGEADSGGQGFGADDGSYDWDVASIDLGTSGDDAPEEPVGIAGTGAADDDFEEEIEDEAPEAKKLSLQMSQEPAAPLSDDDFDLGNDQPDDEPDVAAAAQVTREDTPEMQVTHVETLEAASEAPAGDAAHEEDGGDAEVAVAGFHVPEVPSADVPRNAGDAAKKLRAQFQQRKIWDLEPAPAPIAEDEAESAPEEPAVEEAPEPEAAEAPAEDHIALRIHEAVAARAGPEPARHAETPEPEAPQAEIVAAAPKPSPAAAPKPSPDIDDLEVDDMPPERSTARRGRVKTRLLGFHQPEASVDPISAAAEAPKAEIAFPVGWLVVMDGPGRGASFTLSAGASKIGRGEDQAVRLDFGDTSISRDNHAVVAYDNEQRRFFIGHGGKANLVRLNDMPVLSTEAMEHGDTIRIGETTLLFVALCGPEFSWEENAEDRHAEAE